MDDRQPTLPAVPFRCSRAAVEDGEPVGATASTVRRWIMVEQPGPWGRDALVESRLRPAVAEGLRRRAARLRARVVLLRRHGRRDLAERTCFVGMTGPRDPWLERFTFTDEAELLAYDWSSLAADARVGGQPVDEPVYLVCTNGSHDRCCAEFGRPLAQAMDVARPAGSWECSHIGGDRFAGNLLCFPHGIYYGHVPATEGRHLADRYERGLLDLRRYRGRSCYPFPVQAAEHFAREDLSLEGLADLVVERAEATGRRRLEVRFRLAAGGSVRVHLETFPEPVPRRLTCTATEERSPLRFRLLEPVRTADARAGGD